MAYATESVTSTNSGRCEKLLQLAPQKTNQWGQTGNKKADENGFKNAVAIRVQ